VGGTLPSYRIGGGGVGSPAASPPAHQAQLYPLSPEEALLRRAGERARVAARAALMAGTAGGVGLVDLLRAWCPALDGGAERADKLLALLAPSPDPLLSGAALEARGDARRLLRAHAAATAAAAAAGAAGGVVGDGDVAGAAAAAQATLLRALRGVRRGLAARLANARLSPPPPPIRLLPGPDFPWQHRVGARDAAPLVEALLERHPDLAALRGAPRGTRALPRVRARGRARRAAAGAVSARRARGGGARVGPGGRAVGVLHGHRPVGAAVRAARVRGAAGGV
jgi:hypothetical protein